MGSEETRMGPKEEAPQGDARVAQGAAQEGNCSTAISNLSLLPLLLL
jgi:hypothetical protein